MKRILILTTILIFIAGTAAPVLAGPRHGMKTGHPGIGAGPGEPGNFGGRCGLLACRKDLNLTDAQVEKIKEINFAHANAMIDQRAALKKAQLAMRQEMHSDNPDKTAALAAAREVNNIKGKMAEARINHMFDLQGVLDKEQLEKWRTCRENCRGKGIHGMRDEMDIPQQQMGGNLERRFRDGSCIKGR